MKKLKGLGLMVICALSISASTQEKDKKSTDQDSKIQKDSAKDIVIILRCKVLKKGEKTFYLDRQILGGKKLDPVDLPYQIHKIRPTPTGTIITCHQEGLTEFDRNGKILWEHKEKIEGTDKMTIESVAVTETDNILVLAMDKSDGKMDKGITEKKVLVMQIDRKGKVLNKVELKSKGAFYNWGCAWPAGKDKFLVTSWSEGLFIMDWDGKKHTEIKIDNAKHFWDAVYLDNGNILTIYTWYDDNKKKGKAAEIDKDGKEIWSAPHDCPVFVQSLSNGNVLVAGS